MAEPTPCRLGYEEHDGARYCFEHGAFLEPGLSGQRCADAPSLPHLTETGKDEEGA